MENTLVLTQLPAADLAGLIARELRTQMGQQPTAATPEPDTLLTPKEAAALLKVTAPTLRDWTRKGFVKGGRVGGAVRYRRSNVMDALQLITKR